MRMWKPRWSDIAKTLVHQVELQFRWVRAVTKRFLGLTAPVKIIPYRGYGNEQQLVIMGRVVEDRPVGIPKQTDPWWQNVKAMYRRFVIDEIPGVCIRVTVQEECAETTTDRFGYFQVTMPAPGRMETSGSWVPVELELLNNVCGDQGGVRAQGHVLMGSARSRFGIISDVDDTIIHTNATDFWKMARITVLKNVLTRVPLPGVSRFYRALERNEAGEAVNPFFYVSSSAWNLYDLMKDFLDLHDIPAGPILMRDLRLDDNKFIKSGHEHKLEKIESIMRMCCELPFVLIGDAGQDDPVIYREIVRRRPHQVLAIYIRAVGKERRNQRVRKMIGESRDADVPMLLVEEADEAIAHAESIGLIAPADKGVNVRPPPGNFPSSD